MSVRLLLSISKTYSGPFSGGQTFDSIKLGCNHVLAAGNGCLL